MRIITGKLKGKHFNVPDDTDIRPTADRVKESIFNWLDARFFFEGTLILDLFAGSGNLGFEAISRGAKRVTSVEIESDNTKLIEKSAQQLGVSEQMRIVCSDVQQFLTGVPIPHHFIFCDPPYDYPLMDEIVDLIFQENWLTEEGWLFLEHDKYKDFSNHPHFVLSKTYGRTVVSIFQNKPEKS